MELSSAIDFARGRRESVLTTIRSNGRPQLSNVLHMVGDDGIIRISVTARRAKYRNVLARAVGGAAREQRRLLRVRRARG